MVSEPTIGIHDNLPPGQTAVTQGPAHYKSSRGINEKLGVFIKHLRRYDLLDHLLDDGFTQGVMVHLRSVLGRYHNGMDPLGLALLIFNRDLGLAVRPQPGECPGLSGMGESSRQTVGQKNRHGHQGGGIFAGIAEHEPLVSGTLLLV